jgi:hypothetical protein
VQSAKFQLQRARVRARSVCVAVSCTGCSKGFVGYGVFTHVGFPLPHSLSVKSPTTTPPLSPSPSPVTTVSSSSLSCSPSPVSRCCELLGFVVCHCLSFSEVRYRLRRLLRSLSRVHWPSVTGVVSLALLQPRHCQTPPAMSWSPTCGEIPSAPLAAASSSRWRRFCTWTPSPSRPCKIWFVPLAPVSVQPLGCGGAHAVWVRARDWAVVHCGG